MKRFVITTICAAALLAATGCDEKLPNRDHIPILRERLYQLQVAVAEKNRAAIDSLLSVEILEIDQSSDSLLSFVYNHEGRYYPFERFGRYSITYTNDMAQIECYVMDSTNVSNRPIKLIYSYDDDMWLLRKFVPSDSEQGTVEE